MLGEPQIASQLKDAYRTAKTHNELGPVMDAGQAPLTLVIDAWYTRSLMGIHKLGETAVERTKVFRPSGIPTRAP